VADLHNKFPRLREFSNPGHLKDHVRRPGNEDLAKQVMGFRYRMLQQLERHTIEIEKDTFAKLVPKSSRKAFSLLPLASPHAKFIEISTTTLKELAGWGKQLVEGRVKKSGIKTKAKRKGKGKGRGRFKRYSNDESTFVKCFPGLVKIRGFKLLMQRKDREFAHLLRTDGVSCSIIMLRPKDAIPRPKQFVAGKGWVTVEHTDMSSWNPPQIPVEGQRHVFVDPGNRDFLTAVIANPDDYSDYSNTISISMKQYMHDSNRTKSNRQGNNMLKHTRVTVNGIRKSLATALRKDVPTARAASAAKLLEHVRAVHPLLKTWLNLHLRRSSRLRRLRVVIRRHAALDKICHKICGTNRALHPGKPLNGELPTLVGFGAAGCSAGFGYACGPLKMLRVRLEQHGAIVTLLNEDYTSQRCVSCKSQLKKVYGHDKKGTRKLVWELKKCTSATCCGGRGPRFWQRDVNAAANMLVLYLRLATDGQRPSYLRRRR